MTQKLQEQPGALSVRKPQQRGTRATEDGGLGGRTAAGPGGTKARGAVDTAEGCCAAPRARDGCSAGQAWVLMLHRTHVRHAWRKSVGGGGSSGRAQGGPIWWDGGQVGEESVGLGSAPIPQSCCAASWDPERDRHGTCGTQLILECSRPWNSEQELMELCLEVSQGRDPRSPRWPEGQVIPWEPAAV